MVNSLPDGTSISDEQLRSIVRLLGEVGGLDASLEIKRRCLMEGLSQMIEADGWIWTIGQVDPESDAPMSMGHMYGGLTDKQVAALLNASTDTTDPSPDDEHLAALVAEGRHFTRTRQQMVDDDTWYSSNSVKIYRLKQGIDHCMYSITPLETGGFTGVGFFRFKERDAFTECQRKIAHVVTTEVRWLCDTNLPAEKGGEVMALSPRLRSIFTLLIDGSSCEEIAELLTLSPHTVKGYMKDVYRHFKVRSQLSLIKQFRTTGA